MNRKSLTVLAAIAVGLVLLVTAYQAGERIESPGDGALFLDGFAADANDIQRVRLQFAGDQDGFTIERKDGVWVVDARDGYPANFSRLAELVSALAEARIVEEKTSNPDNYAQLGVDDPSTGGSGTHLSLSGDGFVYDVIVGEIARRTFRYARIPTDQTSYLVDQQLNLPQSPDDWLQTNIVDIPADRIRRVTIEHADGESITVEKQAADDADFSVPDIPDNRELSYESVANSIAGALSTLTFDEVRRASEARPTTTTVFETWSGLTVTLSIVAGDDSDWLSVRAAKNDSQQDGVDSTEFVPDPAAEADAINERVGGWQYRVAEHKSNQLARRWEDILKSDDSS